MNELFDAKESLSPAEREDSLFQRLPTLIENAKANSEHYGNIFADIDASIASNREGSPSFQLLANSMSQACSNSSRRLVV